MEAACAAVVVALALDAHLDRVGKDKQALALLKTAQWLHARLAQLLEVWKTVAVVTSAPDVVGAAAGGPRCVSTHGRPSVGFLCPRPPEGPGSH